MVHFPGFARTRLCIQRAVTGFCPVGFPHSEIPGSMGASPSPRLIAGSHVLLRRLAPRHPPYALSSLTIKSAQHTATIDRFGDLMIEGLKNCFSITQSRDHSINQCAAAPHRFTFAPHRTVQGFAFCSVRISAGQMSTCRRRTIQFSKIAECQVAV